MEQHIGHRAYYENLRRGVEDLSGITTNWVEVTYSRSNVRNMFDSILPESLKGSLAGRAQVLEGLSGYPAEVVFFNTQVPAALVGRALKKPYVLATDITPRQYDGMAEAYGHKVDDFPLIAKYKHHTNRRLFAGAARLLPWSHWTASSLVEDYGVDPQRIEIVPPGVDLSFWQPNPEMRRNSKVRILFVGGDFERKGGPALLKAFRALPPGKAELALVTTSDVPQVPGVKVYRDMKPNTPELLALFQSSEVFVLPTHAEAFGIAAVEASAVGLPVIASAVGGIADIVLQCQTGYLIDPGDVVALAIRLRQLIDDQALRERFGYAARQRAETNFDSHHNAMRIIKTMSETIKRKEATSDQSKFVLTGKENPGT